MIHSLYYCAFEIDRQRFYTFDLPKAVRTLHALDLESLVCECAQRFHDSELGFFHAWPITFVLSQKADHEPFAELGHFRVTRLERKGGFQFVAKRVH